MPHILIIDTQADIRDLLERMLRRAGYEVQSAATPALALAAAQSAPPSLVLADCPYQDRATPQAFVSLRGQLPNQATPLVVMSTLGLIELPELRAGGPIAYLAKPFTKEVLFDIIGRMLWQPPLAGRVGTRFAQPAR